MKKSKKKKQAKTEFHQHVDQFGNVFGKPHHIDAQHNNVKTQKFHNITIKRA
jgi:hypothetical protein